MRKLSKFWKVSFAFMAMTLFMIQGCDQSDQNVIPDIRDELARSSRAWAYEGEAPDACKSVCLVAGQHMNVGSVDVSWDGSDLFVSYNVLESGIYLKEIHLDVFASIEAFKAAKKISGGGAIPGKFAYKASFSSGDQVTMHTVKIPGAYLPKGDCFFIAAHAGLSNGETAWGGVCNEREKGGVTLVDALQFPGANWSVYFEFCKDDCVSEIDFTYAWEDLRNSGNDADYNDLVVKSSVTKSSDKLIVDFFAVARGAAYDHEFKIKIPKQGVESIAGDQGFVDDDTYYYITVFPSTKAALPAEGKGSHAFAANTVPEDVTCDPTASAQLVLEIDGSFPYNAAVPYEPFITVWPSKVVGEGNSYDLYIWEVSGTDTWILDDKEYPNGILIPKDWQWPTERTKITVPYPDFKSITDGWNPNWSDNPPLDPSKVWSCTE